MQQLGRYRQASLQAFLEGTTYYVVRKANRNLLGPLKARNNHCYALNISCQLGTMLYQLISESVSPARDFL